MKFVMREDVPDGAVIKMGVKYAQQTSDKVWTYVWLKAGGRWYGTGNGRVPQDAGWAAVERWLEAGGRHVVSIEVVTDWETVYTGPDSTRVVSAQAAIEARAERLSYEPGLG